MSARPKALIAWSSGKDSAWALHEVRRAGEFDVVGALTTVTERVRPRQRPWPARGASAGAARRLRAARDRSCAFPIRARTRSTSARWRRRWRRPRRDGITHVIFGDLFLQDVRAYREQRLAPIGITPLFPLWQRPTDALAREMIAAGVEARLVCVDLKKLPKRFRRPQIRPRAARRSAGRRRSLRRERRVSLLRRRRADADAPDPGHGRRDRRARRRRLRGSAAGLKSDSAIWNRLAPQTPLASGRGRERSLAAGSEPIDCPRYLFPTTGEERTLPSRQPLRS